MQYYEIKNKIFYQALTYGKCPQDHWELAHNCVAFSYAKWPDAKMHFGKAIIGSILLRKMYQKRLFASGQNANTNVYILRSKKI